MGFRALERMLLADRVKARAANVGMSIPALEERPLSVEDGPFLATNMRRAFLPTRLSAAGTVRFGFSRVPPEEDDQILLALHQTLAAQSTAPPCGSIPEALKRLTGHKLDPRSLVLPVSWIPEICGPDMTPEQAREAMGKQGYVTKIDDIQVLVADLPPERALVAAAPALVGVYTRTSDYLGILILRANRGIVAVTRDLGG